MKREQDDDELLCGRRVSGSDGSISALPPPSNGGCSRRVASRLGAPSDARRLGPMRPRPRRSPAVDAGRPWPGSLHLEDDLGMHGWHVVVASHQHPWFAPKCAASDRNTSGSLACRRCNSESATELSPRRFSSVAMRLLRSASMTRVGSFATRQAALAISSTACHQRCAS